MSSSFTFQAKQHVIFIITKSQKNITKHTML